MATTKKDIGLAFVKIQPSMEGFAPTLKKGVENSLATVNASAGAHGGGLVAEYSRGAEKAAGKSGAFASVGEKIKANLAKTLKGVASSAGIIGAGAMVAQTVGGAISTAVGKYKTRNLFELQMKGMGYSQESIKGITDKLTEMVTGTAYRLQDALNVGKQYLMSGGEQSGLVDYFNAVKTIAASTGAEIADIGGVLNKVNALGRIDGEMVQQLSDRGVAALKILSSQTGMTVAEVQKAISKGQISFQHFISAVNSYQPLQNVAAEAGKSFESNISNIKSTLANMISTVINPILEKLNTVLPSILGKMRSMNDFLQTHSGLVKQLLHLLGLIAAVKAFPYLLSGIKACISPVMNLTVRMGELLVQTTRQAKVNLEVIQTSHGVRKALLLVGNAVNVVTVACRAFFKSIGALMIVEIISRLFVELDKKFHIVSRTMKVIGEIVTWLVNLTIKGINKAIDAINYLLEKFQQVARWMGRVSGNKDLSNLTISKVKRISLAEDTATEDTSTGGGVGGFTPDSAPAGGGDVGVSESSSESASKAAKEQKKALEEQQRYQEQALEAAEENRKLQLQYEEEAYRDKIEQQEKRLEGATKLRQKSIEAVQRGVEQAMNLAQPFTKSKSGQKIMSGISSNLSNAFEFAGKALDFQKLVKDPLGYILDLGQSMWDMGAQRATASVQALSAGLTDVGKSSYNLGKDMMGVSDLETLGLADKAMGYMPNLGEVVGALGSAGIDTANRLVGSDMLRQGITEMARPIVVNGYSSDDVAEKIAYEQRLQTAQYAGMMS